MIGKLNRVILFVSDMRACAAFYTDALGLVPSGYADDGWKTFDAGGFFLSLHKADAAAPAPTGKAVQIVFKVSDVAAAREALLAKGTRMQLLVQPSPSDPSFQFCDGQDPEGNWFQISSR